MSQNPEKAGEIAHFILWWLCCKICSRLEFFSRWSQSLKPVFEDTYRIDTKCVNQKPTFNWKEELVILFLRTIKFFSYKLVSQSYNWHLGPDNSWLWGAVLYVIGCLAAFLASPHQVPVAPPNCDNQITSRHWQMFGAGGIKWPWLGNTE